MHPIQHKFSGCNPIKSLVIVAKVFSIEIQGIRHATSLQKISPLVILNLFGPLTPLGISCRGNPLIEHANCVVPS